MLSARKSRLPSRADTLLGFQIETPILCIFEIHPSKVLCMSTIVEHLTFLKETWDEAWKQTE